MSIVDIILAMELEHSVADRDDNATSNAEQIDNATAPVKCNRSDAFYYDSWNDFDALVDDLKEEPTIEDIRREEDEFRPSLKERYSIEIAEIMSNSYPTSYVKVRNMMLDFYGRFPYPSAHRAVGRMVTTGVSPEELGDILIAHETVRQDSRFWSYRRGGRYLIPQKVPGVSWDSISKVILDQHGKDPHSVLVEAHGDWIGQPTQGFEDQFNSFKDYIASPWVTLIQMSNRASIDDEDMVFSVEKSPAQEFSPGIASAYWGPQEILQ